MRETVFTGTGWMPWVERDDERLLLVLGAGADALHQPRTFSFPIAPGHLEVIKDELVRHLLLWAAVLPLCEDAGVRRPLDEAAAVALLDPILLATPGETEEFLRGIRWHSTLLIGHGADIRVFERGEIFASMRGASAEADLSRVRKYRAGSLRVRRPRRVGALDEALLKYTGRFRYAGRIPKRDPRAVEQRMLAPALEVIALAERAAEAVQLDEAADAPTLRLSKGHWLATENAVEGAVRSSYPDLTADAVRSVGQLLCWEAVERARTP